MSRRRCDGAEPLARAELNNRTRRRKEGAADCLREFETDRTWFGFVSRASARALGRSGPARCPELAKLVIIVVQPHQLESA